MSEIEGKFSGWAVLELMGHRRLAGYVTEEEIAGTGMLRIDVPGDDGKPMATQFFSPLALYCLSPVTEELARAVARNNQPAPVTRYEFAAYLTERPERYEEPDPHEVNVEIDEDQYLRQLWRIWAQPSTGFSVMNTAKLGNPIKNLRN